MHFGWLLTSVVMVAGLILGGLHGSSIARADAPGPVADSMRFTATAIEGAGATVAVSAGKFVVDAAEGVARLIDDAGKVVANVASKIVVDGVTVPLAFTVRAGGKALSLTTSYAIKVGARIAAFAIGQIGNAAQRCVDAGLMTALGSAVVGAIVAGAGGFFVGGFGAIPAAAAGGFASGFGGFGAACLTAAARGAVKDALSGETPKRIIQIPFG